MSEIIRYQEGHVNGFVPLKTGDRVHLMVPKCGTNTLTEVLEKRNNWERYRDLKFDSKWKYTAVVRHPVDRWVSGIMQYEQDGRQRQHGPVDHAIEKMVFDCHTAKQSDWIRGFDPILFKLENIAELFDYLVASGWRGVHKQKRIYFPSRKPVVLEKWHEERILEYYADDLALYERAL